MSLIIITLMALIVGTSGTAAFLLVRQFNKAAQQQLPATTATRHPMNLQINDIVIYMGDRYIVEGRIDYEESGRRWYSYRLGDGNTARWLRARQDDTVTADMLEEIAPLTSESRPPQALTWEGAGFRLETWGQAQVRCHGNTHRFDELRCEYHNYKGPGDRVISIELWGEASPITLAGRQIEAYQLEFMPGDLVKS